MLWLERNSIAWLRWSDDFSGDFVLMGSIEKKNGERWSYHIFLRLKGFIRRLFLCVNIELMPVYEK